MNTIITKPTIKLEGTRCYFRWTCDVCGEIQEKDGMKSQVVYSGENGEKYDFDICRTCLDAGSEGAIKRGADHADKLQEYVDALRAELPEVVHEITEWKTGKDYGKVSDDFERMIRLDMLADEYHKYSKEEIDEKLAALEDEFPF